MVNINTYSGRHSIKEKKLSFMKKYFLNNQTTLLLQKLNQKMCEITTNKLNASVLEAAEIQVVKSRTRSDARAHRALKEKIPRVPGEKSAVGFDSLNFQKSRNQRPHLREATAELGLKYKDFSKGLLPRSQSPGRGNIQGQGTLLKCERA